MTEDEIRTRLMTALHSHRGLRGDDDLVRSLLPTVRAIVAECVTCPRCGCDMPGPDWDCPDPCPCHLIVEVGPRATAAAVEESRRFCARSGGCIS